MLKFKGVKVFFAIFAGTLALFASGYISIYVTGDLLDGVFHFSTSVFESAITDRSIEPMYQWSRFGSNWFLSIPMKVLGVEEAIFIRIVAMYSLMLFSAWTILQRYFRWEICLIGLAVLGTNSSLIYALLDFYPTGAVIVWTVTSSALLHSVSVQNKHARLKCVFLGIVLVLLLTSYPSGLVIFLLSTIAFLSFLLMSNNWKIRKKGIYCWFNLTVFISVGIVIGIACILIYNRRYFPDLNTYAINKMWITQLSSQGTVKSDLVDMLSQGTIYTHLVAVIAAVIVACLKRKEKRSWFAIVYAVPAVYLIGDAFVDLPFVAFAENRIFSDMFLGASLLSLSFSIAVVLSGLEGIKGLIQIGIVGTVLYSSTTFGIVLFPTGIIIAMILLVLTPRLSKQQRLGNLLKMGLVCVIILMIQLPSTTDRSNRVAKELYGHSDFSRVLRTNQIEMQKFVIANSGPGDRLISDVQINSKSSLQLISAAAMSLWGRNSVYGWDWVWRPQQFLGLQPSKVVIYSTDLVYVDTVKKDISSVADIWEQIDKRFDSVNENGEGSNVFVTVLDIRFQKD